MKLLMSGDQKVLAAISHIWQCTVNVASCLKKSIYAMDLKSDGRYLVYSLLTCVLIELEERESYDFWETELAKQYGFAFPIEFDEYGFVRSLRDDARVQKETLSKFVIFTTTECNARCGYCFENGHRLHAEMTEETAHAVSDYLKKNYQEKLHLSWFGGEPLMNAKAISLITEDCRKNHMDYYSSMISNGILFQGDILNMLDLWKLRWVQITIDGTEADYNRIKSYVDFAPGKSPYRQIMSNIRSLLDRGVFVLVSLRVHFGNGESLLSLIDELAELFGAEERFSVMCAAVHEKKQGILCQRSEEEEYYVRFYQMLLMRKAFEKGLYKPLLPRKMRVFHCNSDSGKELIILPNGVLGWCNNYLDNKYIGNIFGSELDFATIHMCEERYSDLEDCKYCAFYPQCTRLKICDGSMPSCSKSQRNVIKTNIELAFKYQVLNSNLPLSD